MTTVYQEGPFRNWTAVRFPRGTLKASVVSIPGLLGAIEFALQDEDGEPLPTDAARFQAIITGDTSGASVDLRNVPLYAGLPTVTNPSPSACTITGIGYYYYPSGVAVQSGEAPWIAAAIGDDFIDLLGRRSSRAFISAVQSFVYDAGPPEACVGQFDAPALPGFIDGETITLS